MKNTITTTSQASTNYLIAANRILMFIDDLGFTSDQFIDPEYARHTIAQLIRELVVEQTLKKEANT
jgi:hypothetical protein